VSDLTSRHVRAWLLLVAALACHVVDEALTGFLDFYNPLVRGIRDWWSWFPMPTFEFDVWLAGLGMVLVVLGLAAPVVRRGGPGAAVASWVFSAIMILNGIGHLAGSVYFGRWLPGATSSPLLLVASVHLVRAVWRRGQGGRV
jgi:hypothetical protein